MPKLNQPRTESYLVRLWRDSARSPWRASLHKIRNGEVRHFACPEELWACLQAEMADEPRAGQRRPGCDNEDLRSTDTLK